MTTRIAAPHLPETAAPFRFPLIATIAPIVASVVMWAVTGSMFALAFAALGPITAIASLADSRIGARSTAKRELLRFAADVLEVHAAIDENHRAEQIALAEGTPQAATIASRSGADPYRWKADAAAPVLVTLGTGAVASGLEFERPAQGTAASAPVEAALAELEAHARELTAAPVIVDARLGIGVCGPPAIANALARAIGVQLAWALSPAVHRWASSVAGERWLDELPHERNGAVGHQGAVVGFGTDLAMVAVAGSEAELPGRCRIVVRVDGSTVAIVQHPDRWQRRKLRPGLVSREQAIAWARAARQDAARDGIALPGSHLPSAVALAPLLRPAATAGDRSLACEVAVSAVGPVTIDLATHGPHAVVGGTTGSGKSELLIAWVLAMAAAHSPARVTFLLIDFKGGSAFAALSPLPHTVGIVTDLDEAAAARALASLRAELRFRERALAAGGARGIDEVDELPRLVIFVDEFAAMISDHPDLHALFADLAARGRSLGVHLVLCTQRPSGVVRDSVLANADLRVSLRVNNRADSSAVVGSDAAAAIPAEARGRGILVLADGPPSTVQFAIASRADVDAVASRWSDSPAPRRPWCGPLPDVVPLPRASGRGIPFGIVDLPHEQRRDVAVYDPAAHGHLLVLGAAGSGKSTAMSAIAASGSEWLPVAVDSAWDAVAGLLNGLESGGGERLVLADDLDSMFARFPIDHRAEFAERLARVLRDGPARGIRLVAAAQRITSDVQPLANLMPARLLLRHATRQDFVLAGGEGALFADGLPPGGGLWHGHRVQVASVPLVARSPIPPIVTGPPPGRPLAIVSTRPAALAARLQGSGAVTQLSGSASDPRQLAVSRGGRRAIVVGDVEEWQSRWGALAAMRPVADILFDGCSVADFRALTRSRELPPPLSSDASLCWRLDEHGAVSRTRLPL